MTQAIVTATTSLIDAPLTMSTLTIAKLTSKAHRNIMRDAKLMLVKLHGAGGVLRFEHTHQNAQNGQSYDIYRLPERETLALVSGYSLELRVRIIDEWLAMKAAAAKAAAPQPTYIPSYGPVLTNSDMDRVYGALLLAHDDRPVFSLHARFKRRGMSLATLRGILADMEQEGLVEVYMAPHPYRDGEMTEWTRITFGPYPAASTAKPPSALAIPVTEARPMPTDCPVLKIRAAMDIVREHVPMGACSIPNVGDHALQHLERALLRADPVGNEGLYVQIGQVATMASLTSDDKEKLDIRCIMERTRDALGISYRAS